MVTWLMLLPCAVTTTRTGEFCKHGCCCIPIKFIIATFATHATHNYVAHREHNSNRDFNLLVIQFRAFYTAQKSWGDYMAGTTGQSRGHVELPCCEVIIINMVSRQKTGKIHQLDGYRFVPYLPHKRYNRRQVC